MGRIFLLFSALVLIASFPFLSDWYYNRHSITPNASQIENVVSNYIEQNPKKILDSLMQYQVSQFEEQQRDAKQAFAKAIAGSKKELLDFTYPSIKNTEDGITVIEFFDAACRYCKTIKDTMMSVIERNNDVNFIFRNFAILGDPSEIAAKYDYAVYSFLMENNPENAVKVYKKFYNLMLGYDKKYNTDAMMSFVSDTGIDQEKFKIYMQENSTKFSSMIDATSILAQKLGINSTPTLIIGENLYSGPFDLDAINQAIENSRHQSNN